MEHISQNIRVAIEKDNPSIRRIDEKCIKCGMCAGVCNAYVGVNNRYDLTKCGRAVCVHCGQCLKTCPVGAIEIQENFKQVEALIGKKTVIVSTSPSVRVALGEEFGMPKGSFVQGKMVALLKKLGFNFVLDTNFSADLTICEEASELIERLQREDAPLPQFTSCCPAWVQYVETFYPQLLPNLSTCKSPIGMQGAIVKTYFAKQMGIDPKDIVHVVLTPCVAKKFEISRPEMNTSAKYNNESDMRDTDFCITTVELAKWADEKQIDFRALSDCEFDKIMGNASGAGVIFGNTGGVMEAALRTAYCFLTENEPQDLLLEFESVRGLQDTKIAEVEIAGKTLRVAVVFGLEKSRRFIDRMAMGEHFDFVEVMTCPGGCIGGGGQPKHFDRDIEYQQARIESLYERDKNLSCRASHKNEEVLALYQNFLGQMHGQKAKDLLHTHYIDRSSDLK